jgi:hypothetical protein
VTPSTTVTPSSTASPPFVDDIQPLPISMAAYAAVSVQAHVPIKLELRSSNYTKWSNFFEAMCGKFGLLRHITSTPPDPRTDAWNEEDCAVRSWLYALSLRTSSTSP